jgi:Kyakuja-Dileera-Zisupton transposase
LEFLELWDSLKITGAVGKWHLAAHIPECFTKFTLNFIEGAGQVEGEILETLWSGMDEVAGLAQAMSTTYYQEILDKYMNNSNWQKIIWMGRSLSSMYYYIPLTLSQANSLCRKWSQAKEGLSNTKPAFDQLSECLDQSLLDE